MPSRAVAEALARVWAWHRTPRFLDYVAESFAVRVPDLAGFDKLYIYQVKEGDLEGGHFVHETTFQWWDVDDEGLRECGWPNQLSGWVDAPEKLRGSYYRWPHISFLHRGERVGFGDCFGPRLLNRKVGRVVDAEGGVAIVEMRVVWTAGGKGHSEYQTRTTCFSGRGGPTGPSELKIL
jgi:hypothetical protein